LSVLYPRPKTESKQEVTISEVKSDPIPTAQKTTTIVQNGDSLFFYNGTRKNVIIQEMLTDQILYSDIKSSNGNKYNIHRSSIAYIKYSDGFIDSLSTTKINKHEVGEQKVIQSKSQNTTSNSVSSSNSSGSDLLIYPKRRDFSYQNKPLNQKNMLLKTEAFNLNAKDKELKTLIDLTKREKKIQHITGFGGPALLLAGAIIALSDNSGVGILFFAVVCVPVCSAAQIISRIHKSKRTRHARMTAERYNQLITQQ